MKKTMILILMTVSVLMSGCQLTSSSTAAKDPGDQGITIPSAPVIRPSALSEPGAEAHILDQLIGQIEDSWSEGTIVQGDEDRNTLTIILGGTTPQEWERNFDVKTSEGQKLWEDFQNSLFELSSTIDAALPGYTIIVKDPRDLNKDLIWVKSGVAVYDAYASNQITPADPSPATKPGSAVKTTKPAKKSASKSSSSKKSLNSVKDSDVTLSEDRDEKWTQREWFDALLAVLRDELGDYALIQGSYSGKWISFTFYAEDLAAFLGDYATDPEVREIWDGSVTWFVELSNFIINYYKGYTIKVVDPSNRGKLLLAVKDGKVIYNPYAEEDVSVPSPVTQPSGTEPVSTQPSAPEPSTTGPDTKGSPSTQPSATEPDSTQSPDTDPSAPEPADTKPASTQPSVTEPAETKPVSTQPSVTEPAETKPASTQPTATEPAYTEPASTEPPDTKPVSTETPVTEPADTRPASTQPPVTEPRSTKPASTQSPAPEPAETKPESTQPPATKPPATKPASTQPPAPEPVETKPASTQPPVTKPRSTKPASTQPPATEPPSTEPPATVP